MPPCKFWQQGNCRNGNNCRFEHGSVSSGNQNSNRYAPLQNQSSSRNRQAHNTRDLPFSLDKDAIVVDLSSERPQWILSSYGPGRHAPAQLFGGSQREQSFEEMRLMHYMGVATGNPQQAVQEANQMYLAAEQQIQNALRDVDGAINFIVSAQNEHPNRTEIVTQSTSGGSQPNSFAKSASSQATNTFGASGQPSSTPFGKPNASQSSAFGAPSQPAATPFGTPSQPSHGGAFGAPSQPAAFGQASVMSQKPNPFGASSAAVFGGPSQLGQGSGAFGQPSTLGQKPNPFGVPSGGGLGEKQAQSAFGARSQAASSNPFGVPQQSTSAFGAPNQTSSKPNPFGQAALTSFAVHSPAPNNPFGSNPEPAVATNPFSQSSASLKQNPFGASSIPSQPAAFGTTTPAQHNPFGGGIASAKPNPFRAAPANPFGTPSNSSPFGAPSNNPPPSANPFGQVNGQAEVTSTWGGVQSSSITNGNGGASPGAYLPPVNGATSNVSSYSSRDGSGRLLMFKGRRVQYKDDEPGYIGQDGTWCRVFFPDGPPSHTSNTTTDPSDQYNAATEAAYKHLRDTGLFPDNIVPLLPPMKEWVRWDF